MRYIIPIDLINIILTWVASEPSRQANRPPHQLSAPLYACSSTTHSNYIKVAIEYYCTVAIGSFLHIRELCPLSLQRVQRAKARLLRPSRAELLCVSPSGCFSTFFKLIIASPSAFVNIPYF